MHNLKNMDNFDKDFSKTQKIIRKSACYGLIISTIISLGGIAFIIWIIIRLMIYFGIL